MIIFVTDVFHLPSDIFPFIQKNPDWNIFKIIPEGNFFTGNQMRHTKNKSGNINFQGNGLSIDIYGILGNFDSSVCNKNHTLTFA